MKTMSLKSKLIVSFLLAGLIPLLLVGSYTYNKGSEALQDMAIKKLVAVRDVKGNSVKRYFETIKGQILTFSHDLMIRDAMKNFSTTFKTFSSENKISSVDMVVYNESLNKFYRNEFAEKYKKENQKDIDVSSILGRLDNNKKALQFHYISNNPNPLGSKETLDKASDSSSYTLMHEAYHPTIRKFLNEFGYYDIFLIDIDSGNIVYSVFKELDFATSLINGPYSNTNFARAFKEAKKLEDSDSFIIVDYEMYTPSYEAPASFIAAPIWSENKKIGVAIFQMPIDRLNSIMGERSGMGKTGEVYLVGKDRLLRSDSFLEGTNYSVVNSFKNANERSLKGDVFDKLSKEEKGSGIFHNYLGKEVISAYTPIDILGLKWGLVAEMGTDEAFVASNAIKNMLLILISLSCCAILVAAFFLSSSLAKKISQIATILSSRTKEVASSSKGIERSSTQLSDAATLQASSLQETVSSIDEISSMIQRNADAAKTSTQVSSKSTEAAQRGQSTVESMIQSINDISDSNDEIEREMHRNNDEISKIVSVISEIGEKTKVINDIVFQTKLLSFNASVEAARAGEHGKGFAVVAEEVGNLASMSGKAALEITEMLDNSIKQVTDIVENTKKKVEFLIRDSKEKVDTGTKTAHECGESLTEILNNVSSVNEMVREIASASTEQSTGVQEVTKAMQQLDQTTHQNTTVANESSNMATKLKDQADGLNHAVESLMAIVNGKISSSQNFYEHNHNNFENGKSDENNSSNIISFQKDEKNEQVSKSSEGVKVSGMDTVIPSGDDSRFEDL